MTKHEALYEMSRLNAQCLVEQRDLTDDEASRYHELQLFMTSKGDGMENETIDQPVGTMRVVGGKQHRTLSDTVLADGTIARARQTGKARVDLETTLRALGSTQASGAAPGVAVATDYKGLIGTYVPTFNRLIDALRAIPTSSNSITYTRIGLATNNAAVVQELAAKPESVLNTSQITQSVETYAHFVKSSRQVLDDEAGLRALIDVTLTEALKDKIDAIVFGELTTSGRFTPYAATSGDTIGDGLARVAAALRTIEGAGTVHVAVNPTTYLAATLIKATGSGIYLGLPPGINATIVQSGSVPAGNVLAWTDTGAGFLERQGVSVQVGLDSDDFSHNRVTILAEARGAALTLNANRVLYGALTA